MEGSPIRKHRRGPGFFADPHGFTLVEMMVASALVSVVLLALTAATENFGKVNVSFRREMPGLVEREQFQDFFSKLVEGTWVSTNYLHEPVLANCPSAGSTVPCVRELTTGGTGFVEATADAITPTGSGYIEMFRDDDASLNNDTQPFAADGFSVLQRTLPLTPTQFPAAYFQTDYYASWRLDTLASPPFFVLSQYPSRNVFVFNGGAGGRNFKFIPTDPALLGAGNVANETALANALNGALFLVYSARDPNQYSIQYVNGVAGTAVSMFTFNLTAVNLAGNPISGATPVPWYMPASGAGGYAPSIGTSSYTWGGLPAGEPAAQDTYWATLGLLQQDPGAKGFYLFPSEFFSMSNNQSAASWGPVTGWQPFAENPAGQGVDFFRISAYYQPAALGPGPLTPQPELIGIPLVATSFYLAPGVLPVGCPAPPAAGAPLGCPTDANFYSLKSVTLPGAIQRTHISMVAFHATLPPNTAPVYFGRRLGTKKLEAFVK